MGKRQGCPDLSPVFLRPCQACDGEGYIEHPHPFRDDPFFCRAIVCEACSGTGVIEDDDPRDFTLDELDESNADGR